MRSVFTVFLLSVAIIGTPINVAAQDVDVELPPAPKTWQVCNETSYILDIATASVAEGETQSTVRGWQKLRASKCQTMAVEKGTPRYVYARSANLHQGDKREWKGRHSFCIALEDFTAQPDSVCKDDDMVTADFLRIIPTEERTAFTEPADYGRKAETAGLQRLLMDNNQSSTRIDGVSGRRTTNTLNAFLKAHELARTLPLSEKLDALEAAANTAQNTVGLTLCNKSSARIWSAIAYKNEAGWESRGWWPILKNTCVRPFARNLKNTETYVYARQEVTGSADKILSMPATPSQDTKKTLNKEFCISEASFSAIIHEFCEDQGYINARFKPVTSTQTGVTLNFTDGDFQSSNTNGLR